MFQFEGVENASRALTLLGVELVVVIASCLLLGLLARLVLSRADAIPALGRAPGTSGGNPPPDPLRSDFSRSSRRTGA